MKFNKLKAFTLAEVMVLLLTLSILMAAFAPVFTRRYSNVTTDEVWTFVAGDTQRNAYFDAPNKIYLNQAFIGLQPRDTAAVDDLVKIGTANPPLYSKVVISASSNLSKSHAPQQQMQFRYGSSATGVLAGTLFAGNKNMLVGGPYSEIKNSADGQNTAFGIGALKNITQGKNNTALGYNALYSVDSGYSNTAIGYRAGASVKGGYGNTFIGTMAGADTSSEIVYNTFIGMNAGKEIQGSGNTAIGNNALSSKGNQFGNTAVGYNALKNATGNYNTALGANSLENMKGGDYNTAIGYNSCNFIGNGSSSSISKITCVGANSGGSDKSGTSGGTGLPTGTNVPDRVFLGTSTSATNTTISSSSQKAFAVVEVHNSLNGPNNSLLPIPGGEESVLINGNLVVRGQTFLESRIFRGGQSDGKDRQDVAPKGLMHFKLYENYRLNGGKGFVFAGYDGTHRQTPSYEGCRGCKAHAFNNVRRHCICTAIGPGYGGSTTYADGVGTSGTRYSSTSYDWYSPVSGTNGITGCVNSGATYTDLSTGSTINLSYNPRGYKEGQQAYASREVDNPEAHYGSASQSCCPVLSSDIRLKNLGEKFTAGLDEIKRLNVYHYTFKDDANKLPRVGVIAQDLKAVFPKAVIKGQDGYYRIRWDEMLYAAVNAVKTLNSKIVSLANRVAVDKERVATLKRDNAQMYAQLEKLADELEMLEARKK